MNNRHLHSISNRSKPTIPAGFQKPVRLYLDNLMARNYSKLTVCSQSKQLRYFAGFCVRQGVKHPQAVSPDTIVAYQLSICRRLKQDGQPLAASTQRQWLTAVFCFFRFLLRIKFIARNPAAELQMPRTEHRLPKAVFSWSDIERIIAIPDINQPVGLRDRAILEVFYSTGIRRTELCQLNLSDVDFSRKVVRVEQGKGKKDRYVPIGRRALAWIEYYLKEGRQMLGRTQDNDAMFISLNGTRMVPDCLGMRMHALIHQAHPGKEGSCHVSRHSFATALMDNGCDIRHIQLMMGHSKLETTAIYLHLGIHDLKAAHEKYHPSNRCDPRKMPPSFSNDSSKQLWLDLRFKPGPARHYQ